MPLPSPRTPLPHLPMMNLLVDFNLSRQLSCLDVPLKFMNISV